MVGSAPLGGGQRDGRPPSTGGRETTGRCVSVAPPLTESGPRATDVPVMSVRMGPVQLSVSPIRLYPFETTGPEQSAPPGSVTVLPATIVLRSRMIGAPPGLLNPPPARRAEFAV